jgi:hypothetical protein
MVNASVADISDNRVVFAELAAAISGACSGASLAFRTRVLVERNGLKSAVQENWG